MRLKIEYDAKYFRLLYYFDSKKTAAETHRFILEIYSESVSSVKTYKY